MFWYILKSLILVDIVGPRDGECVRDYVWETKGRLSTAVCRSTRFSRLPTYKTPHTLPSHPPIMPPPTVVSSPGKALIAGGYLVLDPAYSGTVISVSSRFYTVIRDDANVGPNTLRVRSPQFKGATWKFTLKNDSECIVESSSEKCVTLRQLNIRRN